MTARVCYLIRTDRGARLLGLRLVDAHGEEAWTAPSGGEPRAVIHAAAEWLAGQVSADGKRIDRLCLDVDGAVCAWLHAESGDPGVVRALVEGSAQSDDPFAEDAGDAPMRFPDLPGEVGLQPLAHAPPSSGGITLLPKPKARSQPGPSRFGVVASPDVPARLLLDELDRRGIDVGSVVSLWHAGARVWDQTTPTQVGNTSTEHIVAESESCTAYALLDPSGRLVWAWSIRGEVHAAGAARLAVHRVSTEDQPRPTNGTRALGGEAFAATVDQQTLGRLTADWLGWAAQLGFSPGRIVVAAPISSRGVTGLDGAAIGATLRRALPDAAIDLIDDDDPIGLTLRRMAERLERGREPRQAEGPREALLDLSNRAGRAHRGMYRWVALALLVAAVFIGSLAYRMRSTAAETAEQARALRETQRAILTEIDPALALDPLATMRLEQLNRELANRVAPEGFPPPPLPVLEEFETLSLLLGNPAYEIGSIKVTPISVSAKVMVNGTSDYEFLRLGLRRIAGSYVAWNEPGRAARDGKLEVTLLGIWDERALGTPTGGGTTQ